ncbi:MAG: hypothetical protein ACRC5R_05840 [Mycoplasmatales bacterium]
MLLIAIFRIIMIFPFIIYLFFVSNGSTKKKSRLISASFYLLSMYFITSYIFPQLETILIVLSINLVFLLMALFQIKSKYRTIILNYIIKEYLNVLGKYYIVIYITLMLIGMIKEYVNII